MEMPEERYDLSQCNNIDVVPMSRMSLLLTLKILHGFNTSYFTQSSIVML